MAAVATGADGRDQQPRFPQSAPVHTGQVCPHALLVTLATGLHLLVHKHRRLGIMHGNHPVGIRAMTTAAVQRQRLRRLAGRLPMDIFLDGRQWLLVTTAACRGKAGRGNR